MLINSPDLQSILIGEFSRRFREEYSNSSTDVNNSNLNMNLNDSEEHPISLQKDINNNINNNNCNSPRKKLMNTNIASHSQSTAKINKGSTGTSFTSELIVKIISKILLILF